MFNLDSVIHPINKTCFVCRSTIELMDHHSTKESKIYACKLSYSKGSDNLCHFMRDIETSDEITYRDTIVFNLRGYEYNIYRWSDNYLIIDQYLCAGGGLSNKYAGTVTLHPDIPTFDFLNSDLPSIIKKLNTILLFS